MPAHPDDRPRLSVVLPVYNGRGELPRCTAALQADGHPRPDAEVVVVDDASTDGAAGALPAWVRVVRLERNVGSFAARNVGIAEARGGVIAFLDADCAPVRGWTGAVLEAVTERSPAVMGRVVPPPEFRQRALAILEFGEFLDARPRALSNLATLNAAFDAALIRAYGFDPALRRGGDRDLARRLARDGHSIRFEPAVAVVHRPPADLASLVRRRKLYARTFRVVRERHPDLPGGRLVALGPLGAPLVALGRLGLDLGRLARSRRALGIGVAALPAYAAALAVARLVDVALTLATSRSGA